MENGNLVPRGRHHTYERDQRAMHSVLRNRHYSGHSTSPDRDNSPDGRSGYNRQPRAPPRASAYSMRSPSTSPTRPPRSRSSPTREIVRRVSSRRTAERGEVDRSPSVMTNGGLRSLHRERSHESRARSYVGGSSSVGGHGGQEDRLSRFTEYRGEDIIMPHAQDPAQQPHPSRGGGKLTDRERGQSLPPGATIENMREFYKSSQYKSMYQLPPSPTRPAPVLDRDGRGPSSSRPRVTSAGPRVSISEGEVTDEGGRSTQPPEKMPRHHRRPVSTSNMRPGSQASTKRPAPSPPVAPSTGKGLVVRRVVSSDGRRNVQPQPVGASTSRRMMVGRRSSIDNGLDSSFSESEGFNGEADPVSPFFAPLCPSTYSNRIVCLVFTYAVNSNAISRKKVPFWRLIQVNIKVFIDEFSSHTFFSIHSFQLCLNDNVKKS